MENKRLVLGPRIATERKHSGERRNKANEMEQKKKRRKVKRMKKNTVNENTV